MVGGCWFGVGVLKQRRSASSRSSSSPKWRGTSCVCSIEICVCGGVVWVLESLKGIVSNPRLCVPSTGDQAVVCWFGAVKHVVDEEWCGECVVSCVFRQSRRLAFCEVSPSARQELGLPGWAGLRACRLAGGSWWIAAGAGLVWLLCRVLRCGAASAGGGLLVVIRMR